MSRSASQDPHVSPVLIGCRLGVEKGSEKCNPFASLGHVSPLMFIGSHLPLNRQYRLLHDRLSLESIEHPPLSVNECKINDEEDGALVEPFTNTRCLSVNAF